MNRSSVRIAAVALLVLVALPIFAQVNVTTYHNDNLRTGQNTSETILTDSFVAGPTFARIFQTSVDGQIYAQPLVLSNVSIGGGTHNVVYVATENDSVYAFDAATGQQYWKTSLGTPLPYTETIGGACNNIEPSYGITATPVIDTSVNPPLIYVVAQNNTEYQLNALSVQTGIAAAGAITITGSYAGVAFDAVEHLIRPGLLLENGHVIFAAGSHCDHHPWWGWVFAYNTIKSTTPSFAQQSIFNSEPTGEGCGGIWMSGGGLAADSSGNIYFSTGNSPDFTAPDFDNAIVKLNPVPASPSTEWTAADYFMSTASDLTGSSEDNDVGAGGVLLIPNASQVVGMGKEGVLYLLNTTTGKMGERCTTCTPGDDTQIVQEINNATVGVWGSPAFWNNNLYYGSASEENGGASGPLERFSYSPGTPTTAKFSVSPVAVTQHKYGWPTPTPSVSANGTTNGVVWALDNNSWGSSCCAVLYAYDATSLDQVFASNTLSCNQAGGAVKFTVPTVANGKVYVGGQSQLTAYGQVGPDWAFSATLPPTSSRCYQGFESVISFSLTQQCGAKSLGWSISQSSGELVGQAEMPWTLSDGQGELASGTITAGALSTTGTMPRAPVGTPTLSISGYVLEENGCEAQIDETVTGTN